MGIGRFLTGISEFIAFSTLHRLAASLSMPMRLNTVLVLAMCSLFYCAAKRASCPCGHEPVGPSRCTRASSQRLTRGGAQFTLPAGWSIATQKNLVLLSPPEGDTPSLYSVKARNALEGSSSCRSQGLTTPFEVDGGKTSMGQGVLPH
jgi:hypothetical protein